LDTLPRHVLLALVVAAALAPPAAARTVTLGALDPTPKDPQAHCEYIDALWIDDYRSAYPDEPTHFSTRVPHGGGIVTRWSTSQQPRGMKVRLAIVRATHTPRDGVIVRRRSSLHTIKHANRVATFKTHLRIHQREQIALETPPSKQPDGNCGYYVERDDFLHVAGDDVRTGGFTDYVGGEGFDHQAANIRIRVRLTPNHRQHGAPR
jgi:hypothetical protein